MKKLMLISVALLAGAATLSAQKTLYVIDNETVEHFDGSQLKGKTVKDYKITTTGTGRNAITVHSVTTARPVSGFSFSMPSLDSLKIPDFGGAKFIHPDTLNSLGSIRIMGNSGRKVVYVIDGVRHDDAFALHSIPPTDIESISVLKGSPEAKQYGDNVDVIQIRTKKGKNGLVESLKDLPGVKVEEDGSISVNGQPVTKITINGRSYSVGAE